MCHHLDQLFRLKHRFVICNGKGSILGYGKHPSLNPRAEPPTFDNVFTCGSLGVSQLETDEFTGFRKYSSQRMLHNSVWRGLCSSDLVLLKKTGSTCNRAFGLRNKKIIAISKAEVNKSSSLHVYLSQDSQNCGWEIIAQQAGDSLLRSLQVCCGRFCIRFHRRSHAVSTVRAVRPN